MPLTSDQLRQLNDLVTQRADALAALRLADLTGVSHGRALAMVARERAPERTLSAKRTPLAKTRANTKARSSSEPTQQRPKPAAVHPSLRDLLADRDRRAATNPKRVTSADLAAEREVLRGRAEARQVDRRRPGLMGSTSQ